MSSNISQSYPYSSETEAQRSAAVSAAVEAFAGLGEKVAAQATPLGAVVDADHGMPARWWVWVCPRDDARGRLHVCGYARERHALLTVCDTCGSIYLR